MALATEATDLHTVVLTVTAAMGQAMARTAQVMEVEDMEAMAARLTAAVMAPMEVDMAEAMEVVLAIMEAVMEVAMAATALVEVTALK